MGYGTGNFFALDPFRGQGTSPEPGGFLVFQGEILPLTHNAANTEHFHEPIFGLTGLEYDFPVIKKSRAGGTRKEYIPPGSGFPSARLKLSLNFIKAEAFLLFFLVNLIYACGNLYYIKESPLKVYEASLSLAVINMTVESEEVVVKEVQERRGTGDPLVFIDMQTGEIFGEAVIVIDGETPAVNVEPVAVKAVQGAEKNEKPAFSAEHDTERYEARNPVVFGVPKGYVALTFDDGPSPYTRKIVDILLKHNVGATFFFIGRSAAGNPDAVRYAANNGMEVGSHSWSHSNLTLLSSSLQKNEIKRTSELLTSLTGKPVTIFRPPYGNFNQMLQKNLDEHELKLIMWNRDIRDWRVSGKNELLSRFYNTNPSGGIYVLHERYYTVEALPEMIAHLKQRNLKFLLIQ